jgi:hypothetical protein
MARLTKLRNISKEVIEVVHRDGSKTSLPPGGVLENIDVVNASALFSVAEITRDLTEVQGVNPDVRRIQQRLLG